MRTVTRQHYDKFRYSIDVSQKMLNRLSKEINPSGNMKVLLFTAKIQSILWMCVCIVREGMEMSMLCSDVDDNLDNALCDKLDGIYSDTNIIQLREMCMICVESAQIYSNIKPISSL